MRNAVLKNRTNCWKKSRINKGIPGGPGLAGTGRETLLPALAMPEQVSLLQASRGNRPGLT
jgi:hypothetical protein